MVLSYVSALPYPFEFKAPFRGAAASHEWKEKFLEHPKVWPTDNFLEATVCRPQGPNDGKVLMSGRSKYYMAFYTKKILSYFLVNFVSPCIIVCIAQNRFKSLQLMKEDFNTPCASLLPPPFPPPSPPSHFKKWWFIFKKTRNWTKIQYYYVIINCVFIFAPSLKGLNPRS